MNIDALRRDLAAKQAEARKKFETVSTAAQTEDRLTTPEERASVQALVDEASAIKAKIDRVESDAALGRAIEALVAPDSGNGHSNLTARPQDIAAWQGPLAPITLT